MQYLACYIGMCLIVDHVNKGIIGYETAINSSIPPFGKVARGIDLLTPHTVYIIAEVGRLETDKDFSECIVQSAIFKLVYKSTNKIN